MFWGGVLHVSRSLYNRNATSRVSNYFREIGKKHCPQWESAWRSSEGFSEDLLREQSETGNLSYHTHVNGVVCYSPETQESSGLEYSVSLYEPGRYRNYLLNVRLPMEMGGGQRLEKEKHERLAQKAWNLCPKVFSYSDLRDLDAFFDPVAAFPTLIELGRQLRVFGQAVVPDLDFVNPSPSLNGKLVFANDAVTRLDTLSHMLQLVCLKRFGLDARKLSQVQADCWNALVDFTAIYHWGWGAGIRLKADNSAVEDKSFVFHDIPAFSSPDVVQRFLTQKLLSRLIRTMDEQGSEEEKDYFKSQWLKTSRDLADVADDAEALENTLLAEHLSSWKLILKYTPQLKLDGRIHGSELYFDGGLINSSVKAELLRQLELQGYQAEKVEEAYIFTPPDFDQNWYRMWPYGLPLNLGGDIYKAE